MSATSSVFRKFDDNQSSAIQSILIDDTEVIVTFRSSQKAYAFTTTPNYAEFLTDMLTNDNVLEAVSIGGTIADARKTGELQSANI